MAKPQPTWRHNPPLTDGGNSCQLLHGTRIWKPQAKPVGYVWPQRLPHLVKVEKAEEKGSDVNLATHLVRDAFLNEFDVAVVITNDTDLIEPIKVVRTTATSNSFKK